VIDGANALMSHPGLSPGDAFHAAHAIEAGCDVIVSSDSGFDGVSALRRLAPE
jgi:predicted nucleic acid-binding protein